MAVEKSTTAVQPFVTSESPSMENFNLRIEQANAALAGKQGKLTGTAGKIVGFNTNGEPVAQENTAIKLKTPRKIGDANFDGAADITLAQMGVDAAIASAIANIDPGTGSGGNADTATKLATARSIDGVNFDGSAAITHYGTCSTAAATAAKVVALTGFTLVTGARIAVKFTVTNTAASPTLNVNSTGAKAIYYRGAAITAGYLAANRTYEFVYNGTQYELVGDVDTNTTYTPANVAPLAAGTAAVGTSVKFAREDHVHPAQTSVTGNAGTATKLKTARDITLTGDVTGSAQFDGSANVSITSVRRGVSVTIEAGGAVTNPWHKFASITLPGGDIGVSISFHVRKGFSDAGKQLGILTAFSQQSLSSNNITSASFHWEYCSTDINLSSFVLAYGKNADSKNVVELWCKCTSGWSGYNFDVIAEGGRKGIDTNRWTLYDAHPTTGLQEEITSGYTQVQSTLLTIKNPISGNAGTATKLATARKIGDANFDGAADITLAQMGVDAAIAEAIANIGPGSGAGGIPSGVIVMWSGAATAIPSGWALCNGENGTPDLRGRFALGAGGSYTVGQIGGEEEHSLSILELASHSHILNVGKEPGDSTWAPHIEANRSWGDYASEDVVSQPAGSGIPHNNMPPYYALCYIMKL